MRGLLTAMLGAMLVLAVGVLPAGAQDGATPEATGSILAGMGYPELAIEVVNGEITVPAEVEAGRTLITYTNAGEESSHPFLIRIPDSVSPEQAAADTGPEAMEPPAWFFDSTFPGFVGETMPGETTRAVVDLTPGNYAVLDNSAFPFRVVESDATPVASGDPASDGTVRLFEMGFELPEPVEPGRQVLEVVNDGAAPHELLLVRSPEPVTPEEALALIEGEGPSDLVPVGGMGWLSPGATAWTEVDLEPGHYIALCFVFDPGTGMPHAMMGMVDVFTVGEGGATPDATPEA